MIQENNGIFRAFRTHIVHSGELDIDPDTLMSLVKDLTELIIELSQLQLLSSDDDEESTNAENENNVELVFSPES